MLTVPPIFIIVIIVAMVTSQPLHNDPEIENNMDHTSRVKRQWGDWYSYKFKTPFYKMKIKTPFSYGGNIHSFGGGYGPMGYHPGGFGPMGFAGYQPAFHMPNLFGWHGWM